MSSEANSSGVAERYPSWSPDGKHIAYFSDRSGEYQLTLRDADGTGDEQVLTKFGPGFRYRPYWSPDSKKLVFIDQAMKIYLQDLDKKETRLIDKEMWLYHDGLSRMKFSWSSDSRWIAYSTDLDNQQTAIALYDTKENRRRQANAPGSRELPKSTIHEMRFTTLVHQGAGDRANCPR